MNIPGIMQLALLHSKMATTFILLTGLVKIKPNKSVVNQA